MIELDDHETNHEQVGIDIAEHFPGKELERQEPEARGIVHQGRSLHQRIEHQGRSLEEVQVSETVDTYHPHKAGQLQPVLVVVN
jgi:hypothetical protein